MGISIQINGETTQVPEGTTVASLLETLGKQSKYLAVERNEELIPRTQHRLCVLHANDRLEIVTLVGGG